MKRERAPSKRRRGKAKTTRSYRRLKAQKKDVIAQGTTLKAKVKSFSS